MLLFADSFEHYGTTPNGGRTAMLAGEWIEVSHTSILVSESNARTGTHSLLMQGTLTQQNRQARRSLKGPKFAFGLGFGLYYDNDLPTSPDRQGIQIRGSANQAIATISFNPDGSFNVRRGDYNGPLVGVTDIVISAQAYNYIETKFVIDPIVGYVEIRVNGAVEFIIADVDLGTDPATNVAFIQRMGTTGSVTMPQLRWDDLVAWDEEGDHNIDFPGPVRVLTHFPSTVTAQADWVRVGAATDVEAIDNVPPDGDTSYLGADEVNLVSEFTLPELPPEVIAVRGIYVPAMARIEDAGIGNIQVSMVSNGQVDAAPELPLTPFYTYRGSAFQANPDGDVEWTKEAYEAALIRIEKTE